MIEQMLLQLMNFTKSQQYTLSPEQYLQRFINPHSYISKKGIPQLTQKHYALLSLLLSKSSYNDNPQSEQLKQSAVQQLTQIVEDWMEDVRIMCGGEGDRHDWKEWGYGLKVFGSYKLKTNSCDGDIDMICIVPEYFSREKHFFTLLAEQFRKNAAIHDIFAIPDAIVPILKLTLHSIQIDLLISRIPLQFLKENPRFFKAEVEHTPHGYNLYEKELRSVNGYRTAIYLEKYCKEDGVYRIALKAIKMWARNRGIYSQIYGYLGGAALSIMLAKIYQLYPHYTPLQLLDRFFFIYANWTWSIPVLIQPLTSDNPVQSEMLIFTPLEPHMNAAHYVSRITSNITKKELKRASKVVAEISKGIGSWEYVWQPVQFFSEYRNFIQISVMADKNQDFVPWRGSVQSKIRKFIKHLQSQTQFAQGIQINPFPQQFPTKHATFKYCSRYYIGFKCSPGSMINDYCQIDLTGSVRHFLQLLETYPQIEKAPKEINIGFAHVVRENIPAQVIEGMKLYK